MSGAQQTGRASASEPNGDGVRGRSPREGLMRLMRRLLLIPALLALSSCSGTKQDIFSPKGSVADKINELQVPVFMAAGVVGVIVAAMLAYVVVTGHRRAKSGDDEEPRQIHGNLRAELAWTIAPIVILVFVAVPTVGTILNISHQIRRSLGRRRLRKWLGLCGGPALSGVEWRLIRLSRI